MVKRGKIVREKETQLNVKISMDLMKKIKVHAAQTGETHADIVSMSLMAFFASFEIAEAKSDLKPTAIPSSV